MAKLKNVDITNGTAVHGYSISAGFSRIFYACTAYGIVYESLRFSSDPQSFENGSWKISQRSEDDVVANADYIGICSAPAEWRTLN